MCVYLLSTLILIALLLLLRQLEIFTVFSLFVTLNLTILILFRNIHAVFRPFNGVENIYVSRFEKITIKLRNNKVKQIKEYLIIIKYRVAMVIGQRRMGQTSDRTNVGWDKRQIGQTSDRTNVGWDKLRISQTTDGTSLLLL